MKKTFTVIAAAAMLCSSMAAINVGAVITYNYDINNDGEVDIRDTIALNQYLLGMYYVSDPSVMDVNQNLIIDCGDAECIMVTLIGMNYTCELI